MKPTTLTQRPYLNSGERASVKYISTSILTSKLYPTNLSGIELDEILAKYKTGYLIENAGVKTL